MNNRITSMSSIINSETGLDIVNANSSMQCTEMYIKSSTMVATSNCMALVSTVLGFDIVELWSCQPNDFSSLHCTYVHASDDIIRLHSDIIIGAYPDQKKKHKVSPNLCQAAKSSANRCHWRVIDNGINMNSITDRINSEATSRPLSLLHPDLHIPGRTEMSYMLKGTSEMKNVEVFIVGFSIDSIGYRPAKLLFLDGIGMAIYVAAFHLDDDDDDEEEQRLILAQLAIGKDSISSSMPISEHVPMDRCASPSTNSEPDMRKTIAQSTSELDLVHHTQHMRSKSVSRSNSEGGLGVRFGYCVNDVGIGMGTTTSRGSCINTLHINNICAINTVGTVGSAPLVTNASSNSVPSVCEVIDVTSSAELESCNTSDASERLSDLFHRDVEGHVDMEELSAHSGSNSTSFSNRHNTHMDGKDSTPTSAVDDLLLTGASNPNMNPSFRYPIDAIPITSCVGGVNKINESLVLDKDIKNITYIANGSNSNIYKGIYRDKPVIIKMIQSECQHNEVAIIEFETEHRVLSRVSHPNIIKILGAGNIPRKFLVLEHLDGGSLSTILSRNEKVADITAKNILSAQRFFRRPTFTYTTLLVKAKDIANALQYLHEQFHDDATIIHRDIKPDNIGFTAGGTLKLFDFGLCSCVRKRANTSEAYEMTGNTGSLRYMAPEVAMDRSYNEKADVYSFGVMLWQMAKDRVPFHGLTRVTFFEKVVNRGERPKIDKSWPKRFTLLLQSCWHADPNLRPSFGMITKELNGLLEDAQGNLNHINNIKNGQPDSGRSSSIMNTVAIFGSSIRLGGNRGTSPKDKDSSGSASGTPSKAAKPGLFKKK